LEEKEKLRLLMEETQIVKQTDTTKTSMPPHPANCMKLRGSKVSDIQTQEHSKPQA
jgi:hypothetical protein